MIIMIVVVVIIVVIIVIAIVIGQPAPGQRAALPPGSSGAPRGGEGPSPT